MVQNLKDIMCKGDYFVMHTLFNSKPWKGFKCGSNVGISRSAGDSGGRCILKLLKAFNLRERERERVRSKESYSNQDECEQGKWRIVAAVVKSRV